MNKPDLHIVSLSGGKDSTAMLLRMLEEKMPVDVILFCDTGLEFDAMYKHIDKLEKYINKPIPKLKAPRSFEYYFYEYSPKRKNPLFAIIFICLEKGIAFRKKRISVR